MTSISFGWLETTDLRHGRWVAHPGGGGAPWRPVDPAGKAADGGPRGEANAGGTAGVQERCHDQGGHFWCDLDGGP
jgi:hypothetical protein